MNVDPLSDKYPSWSPYNYVMNSPMHLIDPDGMAPEDCPQGDCTPVWNKINVSYEITQSSVEKASKDGVNALDLVPIAMSVQVGTDLINDLVQDIQANSDKNQLMAGFSQANPVFRAEADASTGFLNTDGNRVIQSVSISQLVEVIALEPAKKTGGGGVPGAQTTTTDEGSVTGGPLTGTASTSRTGTGSNIRTDDYNATVGFRTVTTQIITTTTYSAANGGRMVSQHTQRDTKVTYTIPNPTNKSGVQFSMREGTPVKTY